MYAEYYASASSALYSFMAYNYYSKADALNLKKVFIPSYVCPKFTDSVYQLQNTFRTIGGSEFLIVNYGYSPLDGNTKARENLAELAGVVDPDSLSSGNTVDIDQLDEHSVLVVPNYFGFWNDEMNNLMIQAVNKNCVVIQDLTQALYIEPEDMIPGAYSLFAPRKFMGLLDGGVMAYNGWGGPPNTEGGLSLPVTIGETWLTTTKRDEFFRWYWKAMAGALNPELNGLMRAQADRDLSRGAYEPCTQHSKISIQRYDANQSNRDRDARRSNYLQLLRRLKEHALYDELPANVTPMAFPILVQDAQAVREMMYEHHRINCARHWDFSEPRKFPVEIISTTDDAVATVLSKHLLSLPCDQRYDTSVMDHIADCLILCLLRS